MKLLQLALSASLLLAPYARAGETFVVTSTGDSGPGSLREALLRANATPDRDRIVVQLSAPAEIVLKSALPEITAPVEIAGPEINDAPLLSGAEAGDVSGLVVRADQVHIRGLAIGGFRRHGISILGYSGVYLVSCRVGVRADDSLVPNGGAGIFVEGGLRHGLEFSTISGNAEGILIKGGDGHFLGGNRVGAVGAVREGNRGDGIRVAGATRVVIGSTGCRMLCPDYTNTVGGNGGTGVRLEGEQLLLTGNVIGGPNRNDAPALSGNRSHGVLIESGYSEVSGNAIVGNAGDGVRVLSGKSTILFNSMIGNMGLPIDLGGDGPTANDSLDRDGGANGLQNKPVLTSSVVNAHGWYVRGHLEGEPRRVYTINLVMDERCGGGAGTYSRQEFARTNDAGQAEFTFGGNENVAAGSGFAATATSTEGTSEYSDCVRTTSASTNEIDLVIRIDSIVAGAANGTILFNASIENRGPAVATGVTANFTLPPGYGLLSGGSTRRGCSSSTFSNFFCSVDVLAPGERLPIFAILAAGSASGLTTANVGAAGGVEKNVSDNGTSARIELGAAEATATDLFLTASVRRNGRNVIATYIIRNEGKNPAANILLQANFPADTLLIGVTGPKGIPYFMLPPRWSALQLAAGEEAVVTIEARLASDRIHVIDAQVTALNDFNVSNNTATIRVDPTSRRRSATVRRQASAGEGSEQ